MPEGVIVAEPAADRLSSTNRVARALLGDAGEKDVRLSDLPVAWNLRRLGGEPLEPGDLPIWRAFQLGRTVVEELQIGRSGQPPVQVLMSAAPILDNLGNAGEVVAVLSDVTQMRELDRLKDDFFFVAAHEIKNPLTAIKGYIQLLLRQAGREEASPETISSLSTLEKQCNRLARLIDRLLDVSRIQLGRFFLEPRPMSLVALVRQVVEEHQAIVSECPILLELPEEDVQGHWDELRLQQVLVNLLSNAVKYSPEGGQIQVSLRVESGYAFLAVTDHGVGIPRDKLPRVFDRYYRSPDALRSPVEGLGLDLFVVREIIVAHEGEIYVDSVLGEGSTFCVRLPLTVVEN